MTAKPAPIARFDGAAVWSKLGPAQRATIGIIALELVIANKTACTTDRSEPIRHRAAAAAGALLVGELDRAVSDAVAGKADFSCDPVPSLVGDICQKCGCTELDACEGGCSWLSPGRCSACAGRHTGRARQARALP